MNEERWRQIKKIYNSALEREPDRRDGYLTEACGGDDSLRSEVEALLAHQGEAEAFMRAPAMEVAAKVMAKDDAKAGAGSLTGRSVAHYRIVEQIGEGGMGVVYRAQDTRLGRHVAIKSLPDVFAADPGRLSRFEREARILASLNHPNIASVHGLEESGGRHFLVLELVEGKTLAERLKKGKIPLDESLEICRQVAVGLEAAHEKGIIHRDLKPSNIKLTPDGKIKILDFGLAKALEGQGIGEQGLGGEDHTLSTTETGVILGTAAYMSPEQAAGKLLDRRTDIWSFGCILFECLAGRRVFSGETASETLAAVIKEQPAWNELPRSTPPKVRDLLKRCLQKDPDHRLHHIADARIELEECQSEAGAPESVEPLRGRRAWVFTSILAGAIVLGAAGWLLWRAARSIQVGPLRVVPLTTYPGIQYWPSFSPDGSQVAFAWNGEKQDNFDIYVKLVSGGPPLRLTSDPAGDSIPEWSPDGLQIAFWRNGFAYLVSPLGPPERKLTQASSLSWAPDGKSLVISDLDPGREIRCLYLVSLATTERQKITNPPENSGGDVEALSRPMGRTSPSSECLPVKVATSTFSRSLRASRAEPRGA